MKIEKITWHDSLSADKTTVGVVVSSTKSEVILAPTVEKTGKHSYTTSGVIKIDTKNITSRKVLVKDGWFSHDSVIYVPVVEMTVVSSPKKSKKSSVKATKKAVTVKAKEITIKAPSIKVYNGHQYNGPFKGKFNVSDFKTDMKSMSIASLARRYNMSWTTAKEVIKYLSSSKAGRKSKVNDADFIAAYKKHTYSEIAKMFNISTSTISNKAKRLAKQGVLTYKREK